MSVSVDEPESSGYQRFDCTTDQPALLAAATEAAREAVEAGECIVLPTDTVYGIGADAFSPEAVQRLLDAKNRGRDMPPPVLIGEASLIRALAVDVPEEAKELIERHWPGPLTIICRMQPSLRMDLGDNENTIALRVPDHELAREILRRTGPMAVSSANQSGCPAALTCDEAIDQLGDNVSVYLDGGELSASGGASSTIVDFTHSDAGQILRVGALSVAVIAETLPDVVDLTADPAEPGSGDADDQLEEPELADELAEPELADDEFADPEPADDELAEDDTVDAEIVDDEPVDADPAADEVGESPDPEPSGSGTGVRTGSTAAKDG